MGRGGDRKGGRKTEILQTEAESEIVVSNQHGRDNPSHLRTEPGVEFCERTYIQGWNVYTHLPTRWGTPCVYW